ncbi:hypothetical protein [Daejeonella sp.]|uniref:hypothetical protein n=1 Tax=Daejeonella sp. TaxID=2805397 RepID=UPI0030BFA7AB
MKVLFTDVPKKKLTILKKMAESLKIEMEVLQDNEDATISQAMEEGKAYGRMTTGEKDDFLDWLNQ